MRKIAIGAALSGALAISAFALPSASADDGGLVKRENTSKWSAGAGAAEKSTLAAGDSTVSNVIVNGGQPVVVGTAAKTVSVSVTVNDTEGVNYAELALWHGSEADINQWFNGVATCSPSGATTAKCTANITFKTFDDDFYYLWNGLAGGWKVGVYTQDGASNEFQDLTVGTTSVLRGARATANATPEPVSKGKPITVTGAISRAHWDGFKYGETKYVGYGYATAALQYKKAGGTNWVYIKSDQASSTGALSAGHTAYADGVYRFKFGGSSTTGYVYSPFDYVDVR